MIERVAITHVAQLPSQAPADYFLDQVYRVSKDVLEKAGIPRSEIGTVVSAASDIFHGGVSCANAYYWDSGGAEMVNGSRNDGESMTALHYGAMRVASGHYDTALVLGICKGSENPPHDTCTHFFADPFYQRQLGLNETMAAGIQMREYMERYSISEEQCAGVVVKNLKNAILNPHAHVKKRITIDDVINSKRIMDPLKEMECAPQSEGIVAMIVASEKKAKELTDKPVWLTGWGSALDTYFLGDKDPLEGQLPEVARQAYSMAGITNPMEELDIAEISEPYAFQELMSYEDLGFCPKGEGGRFLESGATRKDGEIPVNPSGGVLALNPYISRGLYRVAEVVLQIKGEAGERQLDRKVKKGLAHGTQGFWGQFHCLAILEA